MSTDTSKGSQTEQILRWMKGGRPITHLTAEHHFGCMRLGARIYDIKSRGYTVESKLIQVQNRMGESCRVAEYRLTDASEDS